jgi:nucleoside-diphosphate-sugar epimerase
MPSKVLITGAGGFVGRHVVAALRADYELLTPSSQELDLVCDAWHGDDCIVGPRQTDARFGGLDAYILYHEPDAIVHLAATCGGIGINKDNPGRFIRENLAMGIHVLEAARRAHVEKVVNLGTVCSYPKHTPVPFKEEDYWNGYPEETNAPYGIAKKCVVEMGRAYSQQYGMDITNLIPVNMYGEGDNFDLYSSHVIPALIRKFENPKTVSFEPEPIGRMTEWQDVVELWGTGSASREFLHASDCARAIAIALEKKTGADPINLGTGSEITIRDLAEKIKSVGEYDADIQWDSSKPDGQPRRCLDISRAQSILRWEPTVSFDEGLRRTISWYRSNA